MADVHGKVHNQQRSFSNDANDVYRIFTVITLRQVLTQLTGKVHSQAQDQSQQLKRRDTESIIVGTVMNQI